MRLIDGDALINDIENNLWDWESVDGIKAKTVLKQTITDIRNQPTINGWHYPSKGELPTDSGRFLCAVSYYYETRVEVVHFVAEAEEWGSMNRVIAWMPLPEPPKEEV